MLEEQFFNVQVHDRASFRCGEPALDDFLNKYAWQQSSKGLSKIFVLVDSAKPSQILGFYTLSAAQVNVDQLSETERKKLPRYPIPCFRIGRLARCIERRGTGVGELLMGLAVDRCVKAREQVGAYAILVDAKDARAQIFYEKFGFVGCADASLTMYLPIGASQFR